MYDHVEADKYREIVPNGYMFLVWIGLVWKGHEKERRLKKKHFYNTKVNKYNVLIKIHVNSPALMQNRQGTL